MPAQTDILTRVYRQVYTTLTGYAGFSTFVKQSMRCDLLEMPNGWDATLTAGNTPFMGLLPGKFNWRLFHFDASAVQMTLRYTVGIVGNNLGIVTVNQAKLVTAQAIVAAGPYLGMPGLVINPVLPIDGGDDAGAQNQWARGHSRWVSLMTLVVPDVTVPTADFLAGTYLGAD